jgi:hypothetical protein
LSTLAIRESDRLGGGALVLRYPDLVLLALALPIFVLADWPMLGYGVAAAVWLAQHAIQLFAESRSRRALGEGDRKTALGVIAGATLARVWLVSLSILLVGGLGEREDGLAAAVLCAALVTLSLAGRALSRLVDGEGAQ